MHTVDVWQSNCCNCWHSITLTFCQDRHSPYLLAYYQRLLGRTAPWHEVVNGQLSSKLEWRQLQQTTCLEYGCFTRKDCARDHVVLDIVWCAARWSFILFHCCSGSRPSIIRLTSPNLKLPTSLHNSWLTSTCETYVFTKHTEKKKQLMQRSRVKAGHWRYLWLMAIISQYLLTSNALCIKDHILVLPCYLVLIDSKKPVCKHMNDIIWLCRTCKLS